MGHNAVIRIVIYSILILALVGILIGVLSFDSIASIDRARNQGDNASLQATIAEVPPMQVLPNEESIQLAPEEIRELEIEWVAGSIIIQAADVESITISESDVSEEKYAMLWEVRNNKLSIEFCQETLIRAFGININADISKDLYIYVPRNWQCRELSIDTASADVEANGLDIQEVEFDGASGRFQFENCVVNTLDIDTASGDVNFTGELNYLDFDGASANIYAMLSNTPSRMDIDTMSGDLELTLPENTGFTVSMDAMSSNFTSDFETTNRNGQYLHGDGRCKIQIEAMSGDVAIRMDSNAATSNIHIHSDSCYAEDGTCPLFPDHIHDANCHVEGSQCPVYSCTDDSAHHTDQGHH